MGTSLARPPALRHLLSEPIQVGEVSFDTGYFVTRGSLISADILGSSVIVSKIFSWRGIIDTSSESRRARYCHTLVQVPEEMSSTVQAETLSAIFQQRVAVVFEISWLPMWQSTLGTPLITFR
jgi:hypothetical protein